MAVATGKAEALPRETVPPATLRAPVKVLVPERISWLAPNLVRPPEPVTPEETVKGEALTPMIASRAPKSRVPPEIVTPTVLDERMAPEATFRVLPAWVTAKAAVPPRRRALTERLAAWAAAAVRLMLSPAVSVRENSSTGLSGRRPPVAE